MTRSTYGDRAKYVLVAALLCMAQYAVFAQSKTLGLTKKLNGNDENGYILFTPLGTDTTFLMNKCGQRIHHWRSQYTPGLSVYLKENGNIIKTGTFGDTAFGMAGGRGGIIEEFDWDNNLLWRYKIFNDSLCQHHDIHPMPNGNILVLCWHAISKSEAMALGRKAANFQLYQNDLWSERIIELKPFGLDSAEIVWQWDLYDHIIQDADSTLPNFGVVADHPELMNINYALNLKTNDWIHANSLDYNEELDQIVMSCHNISEFWIIDHSTTIADASTHKGGKFNMGGDFIYRWGNPVAYNNGGTSDRKLFRQHNVQWIRNGLSDSGCILLFNNGFNRDTAYSSVEVIKTPVLSNGSYFHTLPYGPPKQSWIYKDSVPTNFFSQIISGAERLPNGNTLICSGVQGRFFEVTPQKKIVWEYRNAVSSGGSQSDGQNPLNNSVFRCVYYPKNYPAFIGKSLPSMGPIEKNSYVYSCNKENIPPKIVSFTPLKNEKEVSQNRKLIVTFDETIVKLNGAFKIYRNKVLFETVFVNSDLVSINNNVATIDHLKPFPINSTISVELLPNSFRDSSNNILGQVIDTAQWHFITIKADPSVDSIFPNHLSVNVKTNAVLKVFCNERMFKSTDGFIKIFENSILKETIPVASANVTISGNCTSIKPLSDFAFDAIISVRMDTCFTDSFGLKVPAIVAGQWEFRTVSLPATTSLTPPNGASGVLKTTNLVLQFDRPLIISNNNNINLYEDGNLIESIPVNDPRVNFIGQFLSINPNTVFGNGAKLAVGFPGNTLVDSFGAFYPGVDTSSWQFTIEKGVSVAALSKPLYFNIRPNPSSGIFVIESMETLFSVEVFDMTGRKIQVDFSIINDKQTEVQMESLNAGNYMILVNGSAMQMVSKE